MTRTEQLVADALALSPTERVVLVDRVLDSLDRADPLVDAALAAECEARIDAHAQGAIPAISLQAALAKYQSR